MGKKMKFAYFALLVLGTLAAISNVTVLDAGNMITNVPCGKRTAGMGLNAGTRFSTDCQPCYWTYCTYGDYTDACDGNYCVN